LEHYRATGKRGNLAGSDGFPTVRINKIKEHSLVPRIFLSLFLSFSFFLRRDIGSINLLNAMPNAQEMNGEGGAVGQEKINTDIITLSRFLSEGQARYKEATGDFT
jgi:hypothetical protein